MRLRTLLLFALAALLGAAVAGLPALAASPSEAKLEVNENCVEPDWPCWATPGSSQPALKVTIASGGTVTFVDQKTAANIAWTGTAPTCEPSVPVAPPRRRRAGKESARSPNPAPTSSKVQPCSKTHTKTTRNTKSWSKAQPPRPPPPQARVRPQAPLRRAQLHGRRPDRLPVLWRSCDPIQPARHDRQRVAPDRECRCRRPPRGRSDCHHRLAGEGRARNAGGGAIRERFGRRRSTVLLGEAQHQGQASAQTPPSPGVEGEDHAHPGLRGSDECH